MTNSKNKMLGAEFAAFERYERQYERMGNSAPDWSAAARCPAAFSARASWLPSDKGARILDFGCGWGHQLLALWCAGYRNLEGVELVPGQAKVATVAAGERASVHCADGAEFVRARIATYDLIIMNDVLEHVPPAGVVPLLEAVRCSLRRAGRLVVRTPNMASLAATYGRYSDATHFVGFTDASLQQVMEQAGFSDFRIEDRWAPDLRRWRPWRPLRGLQLRWLVNRAMHQVVYGVRGQQPMPRTFSFNLEAHAGNPT